VDDDDMEKKQLPKNRQEKKGFLEVLPSWLQVILAIIAIFTTFYVAIKYTPIVNIIVPPSTPIIITQVVTESGNVSSDLLSENQSPTSTPFPTQTPLPTYTNVPLPSSTSTQTLKLPFEDNFDTGLRSEWKVISGTPIISNGLLKPASGILTIQTENLNTANYTLSFDYYCNQGMIIVLAEKIAVDFSGSIWNLQAFDKNNWHTIETLYSPRSCKMDTLQRVGITINGNKYELFFAGQKIYEGIFGTPNIGAITITLEKYQVLDNLIINAN
jgi:hypothetical protein